MSDAQAKMVKSIPLHKVEQARRAFRDIMLAYIKVGNKYHHPAPELSNEHLKKCKFVSNRLEILKLLPKKGIVAEVGVDRGDFSKKILDITKPKRLHLIDLDLTRLYYPNVISAVSSGVCEVHEGNSPEILSGFPDAYFDWIYIDGDHYYEGVKKDIQFAKKKLKPNGLLAFNDYAVWSPASMTHCGVARAVNELCLDEGWEIVYFCFQSMGYNDVVVKKMY